MRKSFALLSYTIFISLHRKADAQGASLITQCYDPCNNSLLSARNIGLTPALCISDSTFQSSLAACDDCFSKIGLQNVDKEIAFGDLSQYTDYCNSLVVDIDEPTLVAPTPTPTDREPRTTSQETIFSNLVQTDEPGIDDTTGSVTWSTWTVSEFLPTNETVTILPPDWTAPTDSFPEPTGTSDSFPAPTDTPNYNCSSGICLLVIKEWNVFFRVDSLFKDYAGCSSLQASTDISTYHSCSSDTCPAALLIPRNVTNLFENCIRIIEAGGDQNFNRKLSSSQIAGISIGSVTAAALGCAILFWYLKSRRWKTIPEPPPANITVHELGREPPKPNELQAEREPIEIGSSEVKLPMLDSVQNPAELSG